MICTLKAQLLVFVVVGIGFDEASPRHLQYCIAVRRN
jgi:hypothetical protein